MLKLSCVRLVTALQISGYNDNLVENFDYIEIVTTGWTSGARSRQKRFQNIGKLYSYLNKLLHGKFLTDQEYESAWDQVLKLDHEMFKSLVGSKEVEKGSFCTIIS